MAQLPPQKGIQQLSREIIILIFLLLGKPVSQAQRGFACASRSYWGDRCYADQFLRHITRDQRNLARLERERLESEQLENERRMLQAELDAEM